MPIWWRPPKKDGWQLTQRESEAGRNQVKEVCQKFQILGDQTVAHVLQEQEVEEHLAANKLKAQQDRQSLEVAHTLQEQEDAHRWAPDTPSKEMASGSSGETARRAGEDEEPAGRRDEVFMLCDRPRSRHPFVARPSLCDGESEEPGSTEGERPAPGPPRYQTPTSALAPRDPRQHGDPGWRPGGVTERRGETERGRGEGAGPWRRDPRERRADRNAASDSESRPRRRQRQRRGPSSRRNGGRAMSELGRRPLPMAGPRHGDDRTHRRTAGGGRGGDDNLHHPPLIPREGPRPDRWKDANGPHPLATEEKNAHRPLVEQKNPHHRLAPSEKQVHHPLAAEDQGGEIRHPLANGKHGHHPLAVERQVRYPMADQRNVHHPLAVEGQVHRPLANEKQVRHPLVNGKHGHHPLVVERQVRYPMADQRNVHHPLAVEGQVHRPLANGKQVRQPLAADQKRVHWPQAVGRNHDGRPLPGNPAAAWVPAAGGRGHPLRPGAVAVDGGGPSTRVKPRGKQVHFLLSPLPAPGQNPLANRPRPTQLPLDPRAEPARLPLAGRLKRVHFPLDKESDGQQPLAIDHRPAPLAPSAGPPNPVQYELGSKETEAIIDYVAVKRSEGGSRSPKPLPSSDPARGRGAGDGERRSPAHRRSPQAAEDRRQPGRGPASRSNDGPNGAVDGPRGEKTAAVNKHKVLGGGGASSSPRREGPLDPRRRDGAARRSDPRGRARSADPDHRREQDSRWDPASGKGRGPENGLTAHPWCSDHTLKAMQAVELRKAQLRKATTAERHLQLAQDEEFALNLLRQEMMALSVREREMDPERRDRDRQDSERSVEMPDGKKREAVRSDSPSSSVNVDWADDEQMSRPAYF